MCSSRRHSPVLRAAGATPTRDRHRVTLQVHGEAAFSGSATASPTATWTG